LPYTCRPGWLDGVVADEGDPAVGDEVPEDEPAQPATELQAGPRGGGQDALVAGPVAVGQIADGADEVRDGAPAGGQDGGRQQQLEPAEGRGGEGGSQGQQEGRGFRRQSR
jgi:hypothetical protein